MGSGNAPENDGGHPAWWLNIEARTKAGWTVSETGWWSIESRVQRRRSGMLEGQLNSDHSVVLRSLLTLSIYQASFSLSIYKSVASLQQREAVGEVSQFPLSLRMGKGSLAIVISDFLESIMAWAKSIGVVIDPCVVFFLSDFIVNSPLHWDSYELIIAKSGQNKKWGSHNCSYLVIFLPVSGSNICNPHWKPVCSWLDSDSA